MTTQPFWWQSRFNVSQLASWLIEHNRLELADVPKLIENPKAWAVEWYDCLYDLEHAA